MLKRSSFRIFPEFVGTIYRRLLPPGHSPLWVHSWR